MLVCKLPRDSDLRYVRPPESFEDDEAEKAAFVGRPGILIIRASPTSHCCTSICFELVRVVGIISPLLPQFAKGITDGSG